MNCIIGLALTIVACIIALQTVDHWRKMKSKHVRFKNKLILCVPVICVFVLNFCTVYLTKDIPEISLVFICIGPIATAFAYIVKDIIPKN